MEDKYMLRIVCSYCKADMGTKPCQYELKPGMDTSHSICNICEAKEHKKIDELIAKQKEKGE